VFKFEEELEKEKKNIIIQFHFNLDRQAKSRYIPERVALNMTESKLNFMFVNITDCKVNSKKK
jgi:hypothetical protein